MQARIGHIHIRYRAPWASTAASAALPALKRIASEFIASACDRAFDRVFEEDPVVYVVRKVTARIAVLAPRAAHESRLADQWGECLCRSVVRTIAIGEDGGNLVRFDNQAEFVARFLTDFIAGGVWERWYYGAFRAYHNLTSDVLILAVLEDNRECFGEILRGLKRLNALDAVLSSLGLPGQRRLWREFIRGAAPSETADAFRIFVRSGFQILDALGLISRARPPESEILEEYFQTRPIAPNWTSPQSLADAVAAFIHFLFREGKVSYTEELDNDRMSRLDRTLASGFDWLDIGHLANCIVAIFQDSPKDAAERAFILRPPGVTPAQTKLLNALRILIQEGRCRIDPGDLELQANLIRLVAALLEQEDHGAVIAVTALLENVVESWLILRKAARPADAFVHLRRGQIGRIFDLIQPADLKSSAHHLQTVAHFGEPAIALVEELARQSGAAPAAQKGFVIDSECAGLFLLVRTVLDIRLSTVLKDCGFESIEPLLAGLAVCIGGPAAKTGGSLDPGAALWAGVEPGQLTYELRRLETLYCQRFDTTLFELLSAQRLFDPFEAMVPDGLAELLSGSPALTDTLGRAGALVLRAWSRWLPGLRHSSVPYLLQNFIRRAGRIEAGPHYIDVTLSPGPLDEILRMAGYLSDSPSAAWLDDRVVRFRINS